MEESRSLRACSSPKEIAYKKGLGAGMRQSLDEIKKIVNKDKIELIYKMQ